MDVRVWQSEQQLLKQKLQEIFKRNRMMDICIYIYLYLYISALYLWIHIDIYMCVYISIRTHTYIPCMCVFYILYSIY